MAQRFWQFIRNYIHPGRRSGTVRFMFPAMITLAMLLGAVIASDVTGSYVRLEASSVTVEAGSKFSIAVYAYASEPVNAVDITLRFDPDKVKVTAVDRGQSVITLWTEEPVITDGSVRLRGGTYRRGFVNEHLIATIDLVAKQAGESTFKATDVMLLAGDGAGSTVTVSETPEQTASLYIYDVGDEPQNIGVDVKVNVVTDIDGDGDVTLRDISAFMAAWHNKDKLYDFNGDGHMSFRDFSIILADFFF